MGGESLAAADVESKIIDPDGFANTIEIRLARRNDSVLIAFAINLRGVDDPVKNAFGFIASHFGRDSLLDLQGFEVSQATMGFNLFGFAGPEHTSVREESAIRPGESDRQTHTMGHHPAMINTSKMHQSAPHAIVMKNV